MLRAADTTQMTDTGRQRRDNEDSMFARAPVFVVADGMGGAQAGEVASRMAVEAFEPDLGASGSAEERLAERISEANRRIYDLSRSHKEHEGMGTTVTAAYVDDTDLAIAHVGDSRAYLFRHGELTRLTEDHSLVEELVRRGKLTEEQAAEHPQRSVITRALGPEATVDVDTWSYPVRDGDVLLLCSDGLTSMISQQQISEILATSSDLGQAGDRLIRAANEAGGRDNITVILFRLEEVGGPAQADDSTMVGIPAPSTPRTSSATAPAVASIPAAATTEAAPPSTTTPNTRATRAPLARTQGPPPSPPPAKRERRYIKPLAALVAVLIVLFLVLGGGYLASRQLYFIGTNSQGIVTIYRGLPYDLPADIKLYETYYVSGVPASLVPADRRGSLFNDDLRSQTSATNLVRDLELGRVSK
jgi:PPM family protein phosphatase